MAERERKHDIRKTHQDAFNYTTKVPAVQADDDADHGCGRCDGKACQEGAAAAVKETTPDVAAKVVGA